MQHYGDVAPGPPSGDIVLMFFFSLFKWLGFKWSTYIQNVLNIFTHIYTYVCIYHLICLFGTSDLYICIGPITLAEFSAWHLFTLDYKWKKKINFIMVQLLFIIQGL